MSTTPTYIPVPAEAARDIAHRYGKSIVAVVAFDSAHGLLHVATYGMTAQDKAHAGQLGEICAKAAGTDLSKATSFEDFRKPDAMSAALLAEVVERQRWGRQKYGDGPDDLDHDDTHTIQEWETMICKHAAYAAMEPESNRRRHLVDVMGLAKSAIEALDRKAARP